MSRDPRSHRLAEGGTHLMCGVRLAYTTNLDKKAQPSIRRWGVAMNTGRRYILAFGIANCAKCNRHMRPEPPLPGRLAGR